MFYSIKLICFTSIVVVVLQACSSIQVTYEYDKAVDFKQYKTYSYFGWKQKSDSILPPFDKKRLEELIANELNSRGLKYVEQGGDLVVSPFALIEEEKGVRATTDRYGYGGYYGGYYDYSAPWGYYGGPSRTTVEEYSYLYGTLIVDLFDTKTKKLVWQCMGAGMVEENSNRRKKSQPRDIERMFADYPIPKLVEE